jgi:hypothetical protein
MASHLQNSKMTYWKHLRYALQFSLKLAASAVYVLWHGIHPTSASHWKGRALIIEAFDELPWDVDKGVVLTRAQHHVDDAKR